MTKNKTLSNLSMAVVALMAATVSCFAQNQSSETRSETPSSVVAQNNSLSLAFDRNPFAGAASRFDSRADERNSVVEPKTTRSKLNLSAATFEVSTQVTNENKAFLGSQLNVMTDVVKFDSKQQFRADDYAPHKTPKISFVPSRGPRMPD
jgi:hypothetical protein